MATYRIPLWLGGLLGFLIIAACQSSATDPSEASIPPATYSDSAGHFTSIQGSFSVSGVYPHLTTYTHARTDERQSYLGTRRDGSSQPQWECGIGALAPWQGKLYLVNYAAHEPRGSEHRLYIVDENLKMEIFPGSVGGTPACRMVHQESNQLFIGHYAIDAEGKIRVIDIDQMPGRLTAIARHLEDPANKVYYYDMEGKIYEVNVHTLAPKLLFEDPLPGWHGKGAYTSQGKLVLANNGSRDDEGYDPRWQVDSAGLWGPEAHGVLAEYDGEEFRVVERRQFTDVTTRHGMHAVPDDQAPLWSMGWDKRTVRLKVMDEGEWHTFLLPKATYNNDPSHGWFTEWPRIREIHDGKYMMDMHGMFYEFPAEFSAQQTAGIRPIGSHLRYVPDFCYWNGRVVLATDETSIQGNPLAGQAQSNLWMGDFADLTQWGPATGYGSPWLEDEVNAQQPSLPYLFQGFDHRLLHLKNHSDQPVTITVQLDQAGDGHWADYQTLSLDPGAYAFHRFDQLVEAAWVRLVSDVDAKLTATFHYRAASLRETQEDSDLFAGLAKPGEEAVSQAKLFTNHDNFNLTAFAGSIEGDEFVVEQPYELDKFTFAYHPGLDDSTARRALENHVIWFEDAASVALETKDGRLRLPKGEGEYSPQAQRNLREVESERKLANIHGSFYELPLLTIDQEPRYGMMRPVATHNRAISDFNTWNGLLVLSGVKADAPASGHIIRDAESGFALWVGGIDDLWKFGKPVGQGGPWKETSVQAGQPSDPYLMTGYDEKLLELSADQDVAITVWLKVSHYSEAWVPYQTFAVKAGETLTHRFPEGFSAHWVRFEADRACRATAWLDYR